MAKKQKPWCVAWIYRNDSGRVTSHVQTEWCVAKRQPKNIGYSESIKTKCDHYIIATVGLERRDPTCPECQKALKQEASK